MSKALRPYACLTTWPTLVLMNGVALIPHGCFTFRNRENVNEFHSGLHTIPRPQRMVHIPQNCWMWVLNKRKKRKEGGQQPQQRRLCCDLHASTERGFNLVSLCACQTHPKSGENSISLELPIRQISGSLSLCARERERERETGRVQARKRE